MTAIVHRTPRDTYHPGPGGAWTFNDGQGTEETNPSCARCGRCDCDSFAAERGACADQGDESCAGLAEAFLSETDALCRECAEKAGIRIIPCDCDRPSEGKL
jgi:hypothetical protein